MKILYCFPAVIYGSIMAIVGAGLGIGGFAPEAWIYMTLLLLAAVLLCRNKWWGCIPGIAVGGIMVYIFESSSAHHHINENPIALGVILYFAAMGLICYRLHKK